MINYWSNKRVYKENDDNWYLVELTYSLIDGCLPLEHMSVNDIFLRNIDHFEKPENLINLSTFLEQNGYSKDDFKNPFGRTKRIISVINTVNEKNKPKVKEKK
jgi:hypothetical protein